MVNVRAARPEDAAEVAGVHVRSWQAAYRGLLSDEYLDGLRPEDRMARYTFGSTDPDQPSTLVATEAEVIRGFVTTGPSRDAGVAHRGEVFGLYVDPDAWSLGVGHLLMTEARAHLSRRGFTEAVLWVFVGNVRAEAFYRRDGWRPDGRRQNEEVWGALVDEVCWRRSLP
jgi:ribosomal protein S18 acetylase RimI-like enzyme